MHITWNPDSNSYKLVMCLPGSLAYPQPWAITRLVMCKLNFPHYIRVMLVKYLFSVWISMSTQWEKKLNRHSFFQVSMCYIISCELTTEVYSNVTAWTPENGFLLTTNPLLAFWIHNRSFLTCMLDVVNSGLTKWC